MTHRPPEPETDARLSPRRFSEALRALRQAQKSSRGAPAYSRFVNRPLGRIFAAGAFVLGMTPNQVTAMSAVFTFSGVVAIATVPPTVALAIVVTLLLVVGYALDAADGQLARLRGGGSLAGEWLDHVVDAIKSSALHGAVLISWFRFFDLPDLWLLVPLGYQVVTAVFFFAMILTDQLRRLHRGTSAIIQKKNGSNSPLYALAVIPADYGFLCIVFLLLWWQPVFVAVYALLFLANAMILVASLWRWFREMDALA